MKYDILYIKYEEMENIAKKEVATLVNANEILDFEKQQLQQKMAESEYETQLHLLNKKLTNTNLSENFNILKDQIMDKTTDFMENMKERAQDMKERAQESKIPDVVKEYLHLTASAVKTRFPSVTGISSEELIQRVLQK